MRACVAPTAGLLTTIGLCLYPSVFSLFRIWFSSLVFPPHDSAEKRTWSEMLAEPRRVIIKYHEDRSTCLIFKKKKLAGDTHVRGSLHHWRCGQSGSPAETDGGSTRTVCLLLLMLVLLHAAAVAIGGKELLVHPCMHDGCMPCNSILMSDACMLIINPLNYRCHTHSMSRPPL